MLSPNDPMEPIPPTREENAYYHALKLAGIFSGLVCALSIKELMPAFGTLPDEDQGIVYSIAVRIFAETTEAATKVCTKDRGYTTDLYDAVWERYLLDKHIEKLGGAK